MRSTRRLLLASTLFTAAALCAALPGQALAQEPTQDPEAETDVDELVIVGSRIPRNEFTASSPVQVLTAERAESKGLNDTIQLLQSATLASGSPQNNPTITSAFVKDGGPGSATVSLRGLGAQRTLVLLNGRRAGPAGTRGSVSAFDLNVLPQSAISRVEILKDGASSVYGSDAIAGVVNLITKRDREGAEVSAFYTAPFESGGEQFNVAGAWGKTYDRGHISIAADYYKQYMLQEGERDFTQCQEQYLFDPATGARSDRIDPRTGSAYCGDLLWGHVWVYGGFTDPNGLFSIRTGRFQFDYDGDLGGFIPPRPGGANGVCPTGAARHRDSDCYPGSPTGFFIVGQDDASVSVINGNHPFDDQQSLIPEIERTTLFIDGAYNLTENTELYAELLVNRRESRTNGFRQYWTYNYTTDIFDEAFGGGGGDPFQPGWTGDFILSPTPVTNHSSDSQRVDYTRIVAGARGALNYSGLTDWNWDLFVQHSRSNGSYTADVILQDAIDSQSFRTSSCVGTNLPVSGRPCLDLNMADPRILRGDLTDEERAFLFDVDTGKTVYEQTFIEGSIAGQAWSLPAGDVGVAVGFHIRDDKINDEPGPIIQSANAWGTSTSGNTRGSDRTSEVFAEFAVPLFRDRPFAELVGLTLSGRYTNVESAGYARTYKAGLSWQVLPSVKLRASQGTSFRAPGLFELFLADETSFLPQRAVDPCIGWQNNLTQGLITQRLADNCANPAGPGGGVPGDHTGSGSSAEISRSGGFGQLQPETSLSKGIGVVWTPDFIDLSVAVDYFDIVIKDEVTSVPLGVVGACYASENFPTDPLCNLFVRDTGTRRIDNVNADFINIAEQQNRGIDLTARYRRTLPYEVDLVVDGQFTWQLEDTTELFPGFATDPNHSIGDPQFTGNTNFAFIRGPWTVFWGIDFIGKQSDYGNYGARDITINGITHNVKAHAEFQAYHSLSLKYEADDWEVIGGVANLADEKPPFLTTVSSGLGQFDTVGISALTSQYTEGYYGRRAFISVKKRL